MNKELTLYTFIRCPWAMRARLALAYMNIDYKAIEVDLKNKPQSLLDISPKGTVPVLVFPDGKILDQSLDIVLWAMPKPSAADEQQINEIVHINDNEFKHNNTRYKYIDRYLEEGLSQEHYRAECETFIRLLEQKLAEHAYLLNDEISIADLAVFPQVRQFSKVDETWFAQAAYPKVRAWLERITDSDFYAKAMQKPA